MELIHRVEFKESMGTSFLIGQEQYMALKQGMVSNIHVSEYDSQGKEYVLIERPSPILSNLNWDYFIKDQWISFNPAIVRTFYGRTIKISFIVKNEFFNERKNSEECGMMQDREAVNHPSHYNMGKFEVIDVIHDWKLGFNRGNAIKYLARAGHKDQAKYIEDLNKAIFYIKDEIKRHLDKEELKDIQKDLR